MIINKSYGKWTNSDTTLFEDIVYYLYLEDHKNNDDTYPLLTQLFVIYLYRDKDKYYEKAKCLIRKDKLKNINNL